MAVARDDTIGMSASTAAPAIAPTDIDNIDGLDPRRAISSPPAIAPATPPRLKAVSPLLAATRPRPAPVSIEGTQLNAE